MSSVANVTTLLGDWMKLRRFIMAVTAMLVCGLLGRGALAGNEGWQEAGNPFEMLSFEDMKVPRWIAETVIHAAEKTGVDPVFVMALADKESSFQHRVKARTSSAEGLFQFLEGTWLEVMKAHAGKHGFSAAADAITSVEGRYVVQDPEQKRWILSLRQDPFLAALMACEMVKQSRERLIQQTQRSPTKGELYLAHFLGTQGAGRLLKLMAANPHEKAAKAFPRAADANKSVFSGGTGKKQGTTVGQVHARITAMIEERMDRYSGVSSGTSLPASIPDKVQLSSAARL